MQVTVRLFAAARTAIAQDSITVDLLHNGSVGDLSKLLTESYPELAPILAHSRIAVNQDYATDDSTIPENAEVALIPPVSGG